MNLSVDDAVAALTAADLPEVDEADADGAADENPTGAGDGDEGEGDEDEADTQTAETADDEDEESDDDGDGDEGEEEAEAGTLAAPQFWDAEDKAWFATLTPDAQAKILKQEEKREAVLTKAKAAAKEAVTAAESDRQSIGRVASVLNDALPQVVAAFNEYWGPQGFDLEANIEAHGAETALLLQARYEKEAKALSGVVQAHQQADLEARIAFQREQRERLKETCPDLVDPKDGKAREKELASFLIESGADPSDLDVLPAWAVAIAYDGLRYRKAQAAAEARKTAKPVKAATSPVRPAASSGVTPKTRVVQKAQNRFAQTRSVDDAVAMLVAQGK